MDIETLLKELRRAERYCLNDYSRMAGDAVIALSTLQAENAQLRESRNHWKRLAHELSEGVNGKDAEHKRLQAENEKLRAEVESFKKGHCAGCSIPAVKAEQIRDLTDAPKLRAELEQVKRERDAAQVTLAETSGLAGGVVQTLFGVPLERMRELAKAELEGRIVLRSAGAGKKCGSCGNFHRIPGTKRGTCAIRQWERNRLGQTEHWRHSFTPSQSYGACRDYIPREDDNHG